jgi:threonine/homoserine/homoserine lactone efflux protein
MPHVLGTALGMGALVVGVAAGIGALVDAVPASEFVLKLVGSAYLFYVAVLILRGGAIGRSEVTRPFTLWKAVAFLWVNPKAWIFAIVAVGAFLPSGVSRPIGVVLLVTTLMAIVVGSSSIWAAGGAAVGRAVDGERTPRAVSITLAALLVGSVLLIWV